uniref:Cns1/TTC4 wheel domain-containing protein n=1 Tax=Timema shepardi TaxID=629360 RepID=A0A7R9AZ27_TIMSH|nr:unnamed protein product [Timema shepardi]
MEPTAQVTPKTPMTDEERQHLAEKLDLELEDFIGGLEKRSYTEGWPEDRWQEPHVKGPGKAEVLLRGSAEWPRVKGPGKAEVLLRSSAEWPRVKGPGKAEVLLRSSAEWPRVKGPGKAEVLLRSSAEWPHEMEKHPFFMSQPPSGDQPLSPLMEGLQQLKYDETENSPEDLANSYKEDGNFNFKIKKYRMAIIAYSEGLRHKCSDDKLNAQLHNNRAAAHFFLKNYRSCANDCRAALRLLPDYPKVRARLAQCLFHLSQFDECVTTCDQILGQQPDNKEMKTLRTKAMTAKKYKERDLRRKERTSHKSMEQERALLQVIADRGVTLDKRGLPDHSSEGRVHLSGVSLVWPVMFLYPEHETTDLIEEFHEDTTKKTARETKKEMGGADNRKCSSEKRMEEIKGVIIVEDTRLGGVVGQRACRVEARLLRTGRSRFREHLELMFESPPEWDKERKYVLERLLVYWEDQETRRLHPVDKATTLRQVLAHRRYVVVAGRPSFLVLAEGSEAQKRILALNAKSSFNTTSALANYTTKEGFCNIINFLGKSLQLGRGGGFGPRSFLPPWVSAPADEMIILKQLPVKHCENSTWLVAFVSMLTKTSRKAHSHPSQYSDRSILGHVTANEIIKDTSRGDAAA